MKRKVQEELKNSIQEAKELLEETKGVYSKGNREALIDMIRQGEKALLGMGEPPFKRNREYYYPREEEACEFALNRYTMAPTYLTQGVYDHYGLKKAIEWYREIDLRRLDCSELEKRKRNILGIAEEFLEQAVFGDKPGCVKEEAADKLKAAIWQAKEEQRSQERDTLIQSIVTLADALRELRFSRVLLTEIDSDATLFMTSTEQATWKEAIAQDKSLMEHYKAIEGQAYQYTLEELLKIYNRMGAKDDYNVLNQDYFLWSYTDKIINFEPPANSKYATLSFVLPSEENEENGLGHVWLDEVELMSGTGKGAQIKNGGFEEGEEKPAYWREQSLKGSPIVSLEGAYPYCGKEKKSIYLCNPTPNDEGAILYEEKIPVIPFNGYTLTFYAKLDGKLKKGLKANLVFENEQGEKTGEFDYYFNRKSHIHANALTVNLQADAILYAITGIEEHAIKAKIAILCFLQDFCQGAEHWMVTNLRPGGSDAYGAVQGGRNLGVIACAYSLIRESGVWQKDEKDKLYDLIDYMLRYMLDLRDRTELPALEAQKGCSNWQTDMCMGAAMMMMVLPDFPNRKNWLYNAHAVLKAQLLYNVNPDGSWPESIRYHHAALGHFALYARALKVNLGENWFKDTALKEMFTYSLNLQTPAYTYFNNQISTPIFGDHALSNGKEFAVYGSYIKIMEEIDKKAADKMYATWCLAGKPRRAFFGESMMLENLLIQLEDYETEKDFKLELSSTGEFKNAGIFVFRKNFGEKDQSYFAIMSSPAKVKHGHYDQGSFIIYKNSIPIIMDSGIEGYFDSSTEWHLSSYSHGCMLFAFDGILQKKENKSINLTAGSFTNERGWYDVPESSRLLSFDANGEVGRIKLAISHPEGRGTHIREVYWIKEEDIYIIRDRVEDYAGKVLFNLPVASKKTVIDGDSLLSEGYYEVDLETVFLSAVEKVVVETGRTAPFLPAEDKVQMLEYIRALADAEHGFFVLLYPKEREKKRLVIEGSEKEGYRIRGDKDFEILIQEKDGEISICKTKSLN